MLGRAAQAPGRAAIPRIRRHDEVVDRARPKRNVRVLRPSIMIGHGKVDAWIGNGCARWNRQGRDRPGSRSWRRLMALAALGSPAATCCPRSRTKPPAGRRSGSIRRRTTRCWPEIIRGDQAVRDARGRYPYGRHAQQAVLEGAYANYRNGETATAVAAADRFIRTYPSHPTVDYAYYLKGLVHFREDQGSCSATRTRPTCRSAIRRR